MFKGCRRLVGGCWLVYDALMRAARVDGMVDVRSVATTGLVKIVLLFFLDAKVDRKALHGAVISRIVALYTREGHNGEQKSVHIMGSGSPIVINDQLITSENPLCTGEGCTQAYTLCVRATCAPCPRRRVIAVEMVNRERVEYQKASGGSTI